MSGRRRGTRVRKVSAAAAEAAAAAAAWDSDNGEFEEAAAAAAADSDGEDEDDMMTATAENEAKTATATTVVTHEKKKKKKKRAPIVKLETLIQDKKWTEIRKRLKRVASPKRIGSLLHYTADNPDVPDDIFGLFFSKLQGKREFTPEKEGSGGKVFSIRREFWSCVCNVNTDDVYTKKFGNVCKHRSPTSLKIFLQEYVQIVGTLHQQSARETILHLWADYLFPNNANGGSFTYHEQTCPKAKQDELLSVTSKQHLVDKKCNAALCDVWTKTELLLKMTVTNGLEKSVEAGDDNKQDDDNSNNNNDVFPLIHTLIQVKVPKFIVWFALKLYPKQAQVLDELGRMPLHWAAAMNNCETERECRVSFDQIDGLSIDKEKSKYTTPTTTMAMVELVFNAFPTGASHVDKNGSHPLALLLDLDYKSWTDCTNDWTRRCVMLLLQQAPEALHELNGENRLLPFLTAACLHEDNAWRAGGKEEALRKSLRQLNLSYEILRLDPTVVSRGVQATPRELYLQQQLNEAKDEIRKLQAEQQKLQDQVDRLLLLLKTTTTTTTNKKNDHDRHDDDNDRAAAENENDDGDDQKPRSKRIRLNHGR
jgi:hypothetical protein